jgi:nitroreductase
MDLATVDHLLTTTRSVRKRLDLTRPVEPEVIEQCLEIALQAPSGSNRQRWHFVVITEPELKQGLAAIYRRAVADYRRAQASAAGVGTTDDAITASSNHLAEHFHEAPALVLFAYEGRVEHADVATQASLYGSIYSGPRKLHTRTARVR